MAAIAAAFATIRKIAFSQFHFRRPDIVIVFINPSLLFGNSESTGELRAFLFTGCHDLNLFQLHALETEKGGHLNNLVLAYEIFRVRAELLEGWIKFAATQSLRDVESKRALAARAVVQTEFANDHLSSLLQAT